MSRRGVLRDRRHRGREAALQLLYQWEIGGASLEESTETWAALRAAPPARRAFATALAKGALAHLDEIDPLIAASARNWRLSRMAVLDRLILRLAVYEFLYEPETPRPVIINEALELAKTFSAPEAVAFVNGVLDDVRRRLEEGTPSAGRKSQVPESPSDITSRGTVPDDPSGPAPESRDPRPAAGVKPMNQQRETEQIVQRRANLEELARLGVSAYPPRFRRTDAIEALVGTHGRTSREDLEQTQVRTATAGRILAIRTFGKANFLMLSDGHARIQAYIRQDALPELEFKVFKLLDFGDIVGVEGHLFRTKTDELTIWVSRLQFLSKCLIPLPEKWHGLTDIEIRYRQRYLDLVVTPESRQVFEVRSRVLAAVRSFFNARGYLEVETPMMHPIPGGALARPFVTHHNALDMDLYLRIAPELYLKRLVVGGIERVYEINRNFRNEGISTQHNPEFTMLEFYEAYSDYQDLMALTEEFMVGVARDVLGTDEITYHGRQISLRPPYTRLPLRQAVCEAASGRLGRTVTEADLRLRDSAATVAARLDVDVAPDAGPGKITVALFDALCEDSLVQPVFVYDYPTEVSPLSKQKPGDPDTVERFELYVNGLEIANAFSELNDPGEQRRRFEEQLRARQRGDLEAHQMDDDYIRALAYGLPPTAGEGVGIDRLVMLLTDRQSIRDVILFPLMRPKNE